MCCTPVLFMYTRIRSDGLFIGPSAARQFVHFYISGLYLQKLQVLKTRVDYSHSFPAH